MFKSKIFNSKPEIKTEPELQTDLKPELEGDPTKPKEVGSFKSYIELFAEVLLFVFFINAFLLQTYVIPSSSMEDSMLIGDHLVVDKVVYSRSLGAIDRLFLPQVDIDRGMIVTFSGPNEINHGQTPKNLVKRVIGLPGETIKIVEDRVFINGQPIREPYVRLKRDSRGISNFPPEFPYFWHSDFPKEFRENVVDTPYGKAYKVPEGHYFCMGDNRNHSFDSRAWGPVPENYIIGRPWRVYWSYESTSSEYLISGRHRNMKWYEELWHKIEDIGKTIINFIPKTRWNRTFKKY